MGTLQRTLFPKLEECWETALTGKKQQLVSILELIQVERFVPKRTVNQWLGRKLCERESIARSFVAKAVYGYPFTRVLIEATVLRVKLFLELSGLFESAQALRAFHMVLVRTILLRMASSFRIQAVIATLNFFPASMRRL